MSHVDDGTLHAYLDGELPPVERARFEAHLAECPSCRARLEEERALIERAGQLLGLAVPPAPGRAMPPLHQLRSPRPWLRWRVPVAWAATLVLALGAGWYARGGAMSGIATAPPPSAAAPPADVVATLPASQTTAVPSPTPAPATVGRANRRLQAREELESVTRDAAVPVAVLDTPARQQAGAGAPAASATPAPAAPPLPIAATEIGALAERKTEVRRAAERGGGVVISADSARRLLGTGVALVPTLPVLSIQQLPEGVIHIEQRIDSATSITLLEWPAVRGREALRLDARPAPAQGFASERLARFVRGLRVEIAGPISTDSLNKLLELVR